MARQSDNHHQKIYTFLLKSPIMNDWRILLFYWLNGATKFENNFVIEIVISSNRNSNKYFLINFNAFEINLAHNK